MIFLIVLYSKIWWFSYSYFPKYIHIKSNLKVNNYSDSINDSNIVNNYTGSILLCRFITEAIITLNTNKFSENVLLPTRGHVIFE